MDAFLAGSLPHPFFTYTAEVLAWRLGPSESGQPMVASTAQQTEVRVGRILRAGRHHRQLVLLGLGSGDLAAALAARLPADVALTVVSLAPPAVRDRLAAGRLPWLAPAGPVRLLADASPQAVCHLLLATGFSPVNGLLTVNPEPAGEREAQGLAWLRRLLTATRQLPPPPDPPALPDQPTLALLARPDEPQLDAFFQSVRGLARQAVIVWDAVAVPPAARGAEQLAIPVTHLARPLDNDFAAQRNAMLAACPPGWVLSLDPDERPGPGFASAVARITADPELGAAYFPRLTLYPDAGRAKVGHGLWPDWQLRLYRAGPPDGPHYVRPLHERLEGVAGTTALALDAPIWHLNRLVADAAATTGKLAAFSRVPGAVAHRLSADYPNLPLEFFAALTPAGRPGRLFALPPSA